MKLKQLIEGKDALIKLANASLPISISWNLKKFVKVVNPELTTFEEIRKEKFIELGEPTKDETGNPTGTYSIKPENMESFLKQINELLDREIEVAVPTIKIADLMDCKTLSLSSNDLGNLDWLITE